MRNRLLRGSAGGPEPALDPAVNEEPLCKQKTESPQCVLDR